MKFVITGSTGNISKPLSTMLVEASHEVSIITSSNERVKEIEAIGAKSLVGSVEDLAFLTEAFEGANAVYTMIPPKMDAANWKDFIYRVGDNYAAAIKASGVRKVVNLSSIGAHLPAGGGLLSLYYHVEQELNQLKGVDLVHLRPGSFYYNFFGNIGMIKHMSFIGNNYADRVLPLSHPKDIAIAAFEELTALNIKGKNVRYTVSDELSADEIARVLGNAIGKPDLKWVRFKDEDTLNGMIQAGLTPDVAKNLVEMGQAVQRGDNVSDYIQHRPALSPTKLKDFAKEFALAYKNAQ